MSVEKMDFESKDWAPWLENCIKGLFDEDVKCIGMVAITRDGVAQTAYHIRQTAERLGMAEGEVVDILVKTMQKGGGLQGIRGNEPGKSHVRSR